MKKITGSKISKVMIAFILVVGLICAMASPAMAKNNSNSKPETAKAIQMRTIKGELESKDAIGKSFVIIDKSENQTTVAVDNNTKYYLVKAAPFALAIKEKVQDKVQNFKDNKQVNQQDFKPRSLPNNMNQRGLGSNNGQTEANNTTNESELDELDYAMENPELEQGLIRNEQGAQGFFNKVKSWFGGLPRFGQKAGFNDLEAGDGLIIRLMPNEDLATQVLIIRPSNIKKISGLVEKVGSVTFTVNPEQGDNVTLTFNADTQVMLKGALAIADGQWATVVYKARDNDNLAVKVDILLRKPAPKLTPTNSGS